ncbi:MAG TPA: amidohydrolase family protein [Chthoniobacteraceae bacterium]|nr:amidohydrolase family protein [Chthoniobacteraceae bacterium]
MTPASAPPRPETAPSPLTPGAGEGGGDLLYFDAFTRIGPRPKKHPAHPWKLEELLAEMEHCSVSGALVASTLSVSYEPMHSNLELSARLEPHPHLFAIWNVLPHQGGEFPDPRRLAALMEQHRVRAVSLYPEANGWDLTGAHGRPLLEALEAGRVLTLLQRPEPGGGWREVDAFLTLFPQLPVLLTAVNWRDQRHLLPLLEKHRNLHLGFDQFQVNYGVEDLVERGYEDQLLFASHAPIMSMGAHRCYIDYAEIPRPARQKIASGNLIRLLRGQAPPRLRTNPDEDAIMTAARHGRPLPVPLIDMHMHILHEGMNGAGGSYRMLRGGPEGTFHRLRQLGCRGGGFMSWNGTVSGDSMAGNDCVRQALEVAPPGYWGLASFDPAHQSEAELSRLIPQVYRDPRFIGMKPYVTHGIEYHHPSYDVWWRFGNQHHLYAGLHRNRSDFLEVSTLAAKYPNIRWVVYHCGGDYATADRAIECLREHPNVYAEITLTSVPCGIIDHLAAHAGADRILYGSDLPMRDPRQQLGWVVFSRLSFEEKAKILAANAMEVIRPCLSRLPAHNRPSLAAT